ncbi:MAG: TIGR01777 family oxidoreductase [Planctomycetota bacterium]
MIIAVSGSTGLVGSALCARLRASGHTVLPIVRRTDVPEPSLLWQPESGVVTLRGSQPPEAVVHLAGESVASGRWTAARKQRIRDSRVRGTQVLVEGLRRIGLPRVFVTASAIGLYGSRGEEVLTEASSPGEGFLAEVATDWEGASASLESDGVRRVVVRIGLVLSPDGGLLPRVALPIRWFVGGRLAHGNQWMSWIALGDLCAILERAATEPTMRGTYNATSPSPIRNRDFVATLARVLHRPALFPVPTFALRLALGEMATEVLSSTRVQPARLLAEGFSFESPDLEPCLRELLGRSGGES